MIISHKINQHLDRNEETVLDMVQGDTGRELAMHLHWQNAMWTIPEGTKAMIRFAKSDGTGGCYDTLPDSSAAWRVSGNVLTVRLAPQVLAVPGIARVQVLLVQNQEAVATFSVLIRVQSDPSMEVMDSEDYVNLSGWIAEEVAKQVTDAVAPPAVFYVTVTNGAADCTFAQLEAAWEKKQGLCCRLEEQNLWLQRFVSKTFCTFSGVMDGEVLTVTMTTGNAVNISRTPAAVRICTHNKPRAAFAWIDDDGKEKVGHLFNWAKNYGVPFTVALITGNVGKTGWMTEEQLGLLHDSGLVTFASHTQNHVNLGASADTVESELRNSKNQIESWGYPCDAVVYPGGSFNKRDMGTVSKYYSMGFAAGGTYGDGNIPNSDRVNTSPISTYNLSRVEIRGDYTEENGGLPYLRGQVDRAIEVGGLLVFMSQVGATGNGSGGYLDPSADLAVYSYILNYIRDKGHDVEPLKDACGRFANPVEVGDFALGVDGSVTVPQGNLHITVANNTYKSGTLPSQYPQNQVTTCRVSGDAGLPYATAGVLTAYLIGDCGFRMYMPAARNALYLQIRSNTMDTWLDWSECNQKDFTKLGNNKVVGSTLPSGLPVGVSVGIVSNSAEYTLLPEKVMGYLTSYHLFSGADKARQEWQPNGSIRKYIRYAVGSTGWSNWYVLTPTAYTE